MVRLAAKLLLLVLILLAIKAPFGFTRLDPADDALAALKSGNYDTVFVGSSRTLHGVDVREFDTATGITHSLNAGVPGGLPPTTLIWAEGALESAPGLRYMFVELSGDGSDGRVEDLPPNEFRPSRYVGRLVSIRWSEMAAYHDRLVVEALRPRGPGGIGFVKGVGSDANLRASLELNASVGSEGNAVPTARQQRYIERVNALIRSAHERNVRIFFFVPPRLRSELELETVRAVLLSLDPDVAIDGGHAVRDLYTVGSSFDEYHLNVDGAAIFSRRLAAAFNAKAD